MFIHTVFDLLAWISGAAIGLYVANQGYLRILPSSPTLRDRPVYFIALALGAIAGAIAFGSLNLGLAGRLVWGHSIAGAIIGGIVAVELYKWASGIRSSTGVRFAAPLALGIAVGRLGCFFSGLPDYTYGTPTTLPWGVDFGDGIARHPVQLYESAAMLAFLIIFLRAIAAGSSLFLRQGFYLFVGWYAAQRFFWEFLKPYPPLLGPLNIFHLLCLVLLAYSISMMSRRHELPQTI